jgi:uncharacterized protein
MQFTRELPSNVNFIRSYSTGELKVGDRILRASCALCATDLIIDWPPCTASELKIEHFPQLFAWQPEIILLGTGPAQKFPPREVYAAVAARNIGFEVMDTGAACRTFNVLVAEGRRAAAGLII